MSHIVHPVEILKKLIRFDTTNPPGNEGECIAYIKDLLAGAGIESQIYEKATGRPNLIARLKGRGDVNPLLLYGHVDVVTTQNQTWKYPPFEAVEAEGFIWGRGTLDMKGGVAMMLSAFLRASANKLEMPGDVILCILSDEEAGGEMGARFMVEEHPELFERVKYAIGEFGGFTFYLAGKRFYPIMIAEKQPCWMRVSMRGPAGHGALPVRGGAMARLGQVLQDIDRKPLPVHVTIAVRSMIEGIAAELAVVPALLMRQLLNPLLTDTILKLMGERGKVFYPLLRNTVSPSILQGSDKVNVIPEQVTVDLDGRVLPGFTADDLVNELGSLLGTDLEFEVYRYDPYPSEPDMSLFDMFGTVLREADPKGIPVPMVLPAVTDGRFFARLGIQTYGFLPMQLPEDFNFTGTVHGANERIPAEAVQFGTDAIHQALERFH